MSMSEECTGNADRINGLFIDNENIRARADAIFGRSTRIDFSALEADFKWRTNSARRAKVFLYDTHSRASGRSGRALKWYEGRGATIRIAHDAKNAADRLMYNDLAAHCTSWKWNCNIAIVTNDGGFIDDPYRTDSRPCRTFVDLARFILNNNPSGMLVHYYVGANNVLPNKKWFHLIPRGLVSVNVFSVPGFLAPRAANQGNKRAA